MSKKVFEEYFKFGFVENPWDWQVSLYTFMLKDAKHHQHEFVKSLKDFDEYRLEGSSRFAPSEILFLWRKQLPYGFYRKNLKT